MIWNGVSNNERLLLWKNLREEIRDFTLAVKLEKIADFYKTMPYGARSIDYYTPSNWPTPWEILYHGALCVSSISLLIFYTVVLTTPDIDINLMLVEDQDGIYLLPVVANTFVLNYIPGEVCTIQDIREKFTIINIFTKETIRTIQ